MSKTETPEILVDVYGTKAPAAAIFNKGAQTISEIKIAADAQKRQGQSGAYHQTTPMKD